MSERAGGRAEAGHQHAPTSAGARHRGPLVAALTLGIAVFVVEVVTALLTNSLALLSDAGHVLTDVAGLGLALAAIQVAQRPVRDPGRTYGLYRLEILAALVNAVLLFAVAVFVLVEAATRFDDPPHVIGVPVLIVAIIGLGANVAALLLLRRGAGESLNVEGAFLEVVADTLGSVGTIVAALVLVTTGWRLVDPIIGAAIGLFILPRTVRIGGQALRILLQVAPKDVDVRALQEQLATLPGVVDVHDVHVWTLTSEMDVASAHLMVGAGTDSHAVLDQARVVLQEQFSIEHATLQVEPDTHEGCAEVAW
ncbi:MAG TPA: cation diffusion facilitator family transporter [Acidimicrobiia bacterium]|nr:cation diffusion facilitator family transporter [Acidimicrobiia bacterium]